MLPLYVNGQQMIYISIGTKTMQAQKLVELIATFPFAKILAEPDLNTKKAIDDARRGKTHKTKSTAQLFVNLKK